MSNMTAMIAPDGSSAMVPAEQVQNAIKAGAKVGVHMRGPDGSEAVVPTENAHIALKAGASAVDPAAMATASIPKPPNPIIQAANDPSNPYQPMPGVSDGAGLAEGLGEYVNQSGGNVVRGVKNVAQGNIAKGAHQVISGGMNATTAALPIAAAAAPMTVLKALAGGTVGSTLANAVAEGQGATPDQSDLAGDIGGLLGGGLGAKANGSGRIGRLAKVAKEEIHIPILGRLSKYAEALKTPPSETVPPSGPEVSLPEKPPLEVLQGRGLAQGGKTVSAPSDALGKIPATSATPKVVPETEAAPQSTEKEAKTALSNLLGKGLGESDLKPDAKMIHQNIPEDHTPTNSLTVPSYKYDPASQDFEYSLKNGDAYRHGPVEPEDVKAFEDAKSKGTAVQKFIKDKYGKPIATKYRGGKWIIQQRATVTPED